MIKVLGENYYIDLDIVEKYLDMSNDITDELRSTLMSTLTAIVADEGVAAHVRDVARAAIHSSNNK